MRRVGARESSTTCMFQIIQNLKYELRTAFGDSEETFGGEVWKDIETLMGVGQGNGAGAGAGAAIWAVISTVIFDILRSNR